MVASKNNGRPVGGSDSSGGSVDDGDGGAVVVVVATAVAVVAERWRVMTVGAPLAAVAQWRERRRRR